MIRWLEIWNLVSVCHGYISQPTGILSHGSIFSFKCT